MASQPDSQFASALRAAQSDELGAFISTASFEVSSEPASKGALRGTPFAVKDNIDTVEFPTTANTPALADSVPAQNNPVVQRLLDAGALIVGKRIFMSLPSELLRDPQLSPPHATPLTQRAARVAPQAVPPSR